MTRAHRSFPRTRPVVGALVAAVLGLGIAVSPPTPAQAGPAQFTCLGANGLGSSQGNTPANLMAGRVTIPGFGVTAIGTGHVNFSRLNVGKNPTWQLWFNSLKWLEPFMTAASDGAPGASTYLARADAVLADFRAAYPVSGRSPIGWGTQAASLRAATVACLAKYRSTGNVQGALADHGAFLSSDRNYAGDWNHGLEENIGLLAVGCVADNQAWIDKASGRAHSALVSTIDDQGVFNEQSPGYGPWTITRWRTIDSVLRGCSQPGLPDLDQRLEGLASWLAAATQPDGNLVQIGDTYAEQIRADVAGDYPTTRYVTSQGTQGVVGLPLISIYRAGYVFSRSAWGTGRTFTGATFFSMRFGPRRYAHGHFDHESVTWFARGRPLLADAGHGGYAPGAYRNWIVSAPAHNVLTVPGVTLRTYGVSHLTRSSASPKGEFYEVSDDAGGKVGGAYQGLVRTRGVYLVSGGSAMVVLDRTSTTKLYRTLLAKARLKTVWWHLPAAFTVRSANDSAVVATAGSTQLTVLHVPFPKTPYGKGSTRVYRGSSSPMQGWVSTAQGRRTAAPAIGQSLSTSRNLAVVVPTAVGVKVTARLMPSGTGYRLDLWTGGVYSIVRITAGGTIYS